MLKTLYASTVEIDDIDRAIEDIVGQINPDDLMKNSIGILGCNVEYITDGILKVLCEKLPFDVIGSTTYISDICGEGDEYQLSLMVLTSDTAVFSSGVSASIEENAAEAIADLYKNTAKTLPGEPVFGLFVAPFLLSVSADTQLEALDKAAHGIPLFGTVALDYVENVRNPRSIYNCEDYSDRMVLTLVSGDINPEFFVESISKELFLKQQAIITASAGSLLMEVNEVPAVEYLESLGLAKDGVMENIPLVPLSVDVGDGGRPAARAVFAITPEGYAVCGGNMPTGATLSVGSLEPDDVQKTAKRLAENILKSDCKNGAIIFSCMGRNRALGLDPFHEIREIRSILDGKIPYLFMYSAGEIYPEFIGEAHRNKALNDSIIACMF